ncbi:protein canopy 4 [Scyliorhinus canicula]|uniref:protein canopy 4 n=1 Tax=Scyliorhinus canicula TaxID=7830 RepID=UPI0018F5EC66|nr:protein canopy 4 [Scyliorhinus canicula]
MLRPVLVFLIPLFAGGAAAEDGEAERLPTKCEVCKFLTVELQTALDKTKRSKEVLELGEVLDNGKRKRKIKYNTSETRLTDAMDNICERILQYNVHAERPGSLRYAKGTSETMMTLKNLVNKGVKVELGIPFEMWDEPSAEVTDLKKQCENMLEQYEEVVEDWYFRHQDLNLERFLCMSHVLAEDDRDCLTEVWTGQKGDPADNQERRRQEADGEEQPRTGGQGDGVESGEGVLAGQESVHHDAAEL